MHKITLAAVTVALFAATAVPALAQTTTATSTANATAKIACVGTAVNAREQALGKAMTSYTAALNAAYMARASALQQAYTQTTLKGVMTAVKAAWTTFNTSSKAAR